MRGSRGVHPEQAVVLLKAGVGYVWFREVMKWPHCFVHQRLSFVRNARTGEGTELRWLCGGQNPHGSVIVYMGPALQTFVHVFSTIGSIPGANTWAHVDESGASKAGVGA